jgi:hypothetical protein
MVKRVYTCKFKTILTLYQTLLLLVQHSFTGARGGMMQTLKLGIMRQLLYNSARAPGIRSSLLQHLTNSPLLYKLCYHY